MPRGRKKTLSDPAPHGADNSVTRNVCVDIDWFDSRHKRPYHRFMDRRNRRLARFTILVGVLLLIFVVLGILITRKEIVSPVPEDSGIKIIILSPTPTEFPSESSGIGGSQIEPQKNP